MQRHPGTDGRGSPFSRRIIDEVWSRGQTVQNYDPRIWRYDFYGALIRYADYGNTNSDHGWEIDHIRPVALGGGDELANLEPLQWQNNRKKGNTYPYPF